MNQLHVSHQAAAAAAAPPAAVLPVAAAAAAAAAAGASSANLGGAAASGAPAASSVCGVGIRFAETTSGEFKITQLVPDRCDAHGQEACLQQLHRPCGKAAR